MAIERQQTEESNFDRFTGRIIDSVRAWMFKGQKISVHTRQNIIGEVIRTNILSGEITIRVNNGGQLILRGRDVLNLDSIF